MLLPPFAARVFISRMLVVFTACALLTTNFSNALTATASSVTKPERHVLTTATEAARARAVKAYGELLLQFESNKGQAKDGNIYVSGLTSSPDFPTT